MPATIRPGRRATGYLANLTAGLVAGLASLPDTFRSRHAAYLLAAQRSDGGFAGRQGGSDIYYTMFGLRSAELLGLADEDFRRRAAQYARSLTAPPRDMVECFCLLYIRRLVGEPDEPCEGSFSPSQGCGDPPRKIAAARAEIMEIISRSRAAHGGYARFPGGEATVYHTFLAALCAELSESDFSDSGEAAAFVRSRQCADGGYADSATDGSEGATNPTAAALALLTLSGVAQAPPPVMTFAGGSAPPAFGSEARARRGPPVPIGQTAGFLASMQRPEGGFAACAGAPEADLLSTFTATVALAGIGALNRVKLAPIARFTHDLQSPGAGFRGCAGDDAPDVEYTCYGLGTLALLVQAAGLHN